MIGSTFIIVMLASSLACVVTRAGISTPSGALVSYPFISSISKPTLGILLTVSAGALAYVGASHLLHRVEFVLA